MRDHRQTWSPWRGGVTHAPGPTWLQVQDQPRVVRRPIGFTADLDSAWRPPTKLLSPEPENKTDETHPELPDTNRQPKHRRLQMAWWRRAVFWVAS